MLVAMPPASTMAVLPNRFRDRDLVDGCSSLSVVVPELRPAGTDSIGARGRLAALIASRKVQLPVGRLQRPSDRDADIVEAGDREGGRVDD